MPSEDDVVMLRSGQMEWRINGLALRMDTGAALNLAQRALTTLGWSSPPPQLGLQAGSAVLVMKDRRALHDEIERLRASGKALDLVVVNRPVLVGEWQPPEDGEPGYQKPKTRKFTKDAAPAPTESAPIKKAPAKRAPERVHGDPSIDVQLFADPIDQLMYEVRHAYLMTVPISQREQWPLSPYVPMPSFMADIGDQGGAVSRAQIISVIVDVVSSRMNEVTARRPRPMREGGGEDGRPVITRGDGAVAWRANVSSGSPAARRIMWWRNTDGVIELARLATHDDFDMPK